MKENKSLSKQKLGGEKHVHYKIQLCYMFETFVIK